MSGEKARRLVSEALTLDSLEFITGAELGRLTDAIDAAFSEITREQRERDAKIADGEQFGVDYNHVDGIPDAAANKRAASIAKLIRNQKETPSE